MESDNIIVNGLWAGSTLSAIELLCIHSFIAKGHEFHLWAYDKIDTPLPSSVILEDAHIIIPREKVFYYAHTDQFGHGKGSYAGFSDIFRYKLLYERGGWWTDMDVVCLKTFDFPNPYVFRTHHDFPVVGNIMKCPAGSELMKHCYNSASIRVTADNTDWNLPIRILNEQIAELKLGSYAIHFTNRDSWMYIRSLLLRKVGIPDEWFALHLVNEEWRRNRIDKKAIPGRSFIGSLLQHYGLWESAPSGDRFVNIMRLIFVRLSAKQLISYFKGFFRFK